MNMKEREHRHESVVSAAVVAVFAAFWVIGVIVASGGLPKDPKPDLGYFAQLAVGWALVATPWAVAVRMLGRARRADTAAGLTPMDGPARLLATAVATLPEYRRDWGPAMAAELVQVQGRSARWWFAAGCAWAALFPPGSDRTLVLVVATLAVVAVVTAGQAVGQILPDMQVFTMTFVGLVGALATLGLARSPRVRPPAPGLAVTASGLTGVAACIAVTADFLVQHPMAAVHFPPAAAVFLATFLAGCLWLTLAPPRGLITSRLARQIAVGTTVALGLGVGLASRLGLNHVAGFDAGLFGYLVLAPNMAIFAGSAAAAALGQSFRVGVQTAVWTALLASLAVFAIGLPEAIRWYRFEMSLIFAGDGIPIEAVGENLRGFAWGLVLLPFWWLPFGIIGAAIGRRSSDLPPIRQLLPEHPR